MICNECETVAYCTKHGCIPKVKRTIDMAREAGAELKASSTAAPTQEPVAYVSGYYNGRCVVLPLNPSQLFNSGTAFYTRPQPAAWVGLTAKDRKEIERQLVYVEDAIRMTEAKLRKKNGGKA